jgi:hypothetical protein
MKDAIEKHQSRSTDSEKDKDDVRDDETLLDHLVKLTAGACPIAGNLTTLVES